MADNLPLYPHPAALMALLYQESRCNPDAISPVGAAGLGQFMPPAWKEVTGRFGIKASPHDLIAIDMAAFYLNGRLAFWTVWRTADERLLLGLACYNAGCGNILKAQKASGGKRLWHDIAPFLPAITGKRNAAETTNYVRLNTRWRREMQTEDHHVWIH